MKIYTTSFGLLKLKKLNYIPNMKSINRWVYDKSAVNNQINRWYKEIPWIKAYYAVKANPAPYLVNDIITHSNHDVGLDVASLMEIDLALKYTDRNNIIYTNPHTINHELEQYKSKPINIKVIDSLCEIKKLNREETTSQFLIRLKCGNINSLGNTNFDTKFGADREEVLEIIDFALQNNIKLKGFSFHIGSGGEYNRTDAYYNAYVRAVTYLEIIKKQIGNEIPIINFGGGLLYNTNLKQVLGWTENLPYLMIAEPGRYFAEPSHHLFIQVIAITNKGIFIDNGIYHELNCYKRDHWLFPKMKECIDIVTNTTTNVYNNQTVNLFGPTCDSEDVLEQCSLPLDIKVGDWIFLPNMGAYTSAGMIEFNGIKGASSHIIS